MSLNITFYEVLLERPLVQTDEDQGKHINKRSPGILGVIGLGPFCELAGT